MATDVHFANAYIYILEDFGGARFEDFVDGGSDVTFSLVLALAPGPGLALVITRVRWILDTSIYVYIKSESVFSFETVF